MLEVSNLSVAFKSGAGLVPVTHAIDIQLAPGATLGIVGESGSGKSVTSMALMGLLPPRSAKVTADKLSFGGRDLRNLSASGWRSLRGKEIAMVFQDPMTSLNPLVRCGEQIAEAIRLHQGKGRQAARMDAIALLERMGIPNPERRVDAYPFELSGGMRQRIMIAIAISCRPKLLIADEPTTALDVTIQAQILKLIRELQKDYGMALMLITHDLGIVKDMVEDLMVMYAGRVVERGSTAAVLERPSHPYTLGLLRSIPSLSRKVHRLASIEGVVPKPAEIVPGCRFHPRCFMAMAACLQAEPPLLGDARQGSACIRRAELTSAALAV
jgi:peptide/nickel transport system ATP-binding protein